MGRDNAATGGHSIEIRRSRRRTLAIEVASADRVIVRAPKSMSSSAIERFLADRSAWIDRARDRMAERESSAGSPPTDGELSLMRAQAALDLPERVRRWAPIVGAHPTKVQIRNQRSRWGSCSTSGTLSLNLQLMRQPEWVRDYVVVHELAHLVYQNHGHAFWALVAACYPRYREARSLLREAVIFR